MKLLAIETSATVCSVALLNENNIDSVHEVAPMQQAQIILPTINKLLDKSNITLNQLDALAFGCGPGSFTGVRIATSVMQGLGFALNLPLIPISSLAALAQATFYELGWKNLLVAVDARIQEVYWGAYQENSKGLVQLIGKEWVSTPEKIITPHQEDWCGVGNAWEVYKEQITAKPSKMDISRLPTAIGVLLLAQAKFNQKDWVIAEQAIPTYLRNEVTHKTVNKLG